MWVVGCRIAAHTPKWKAPRANASPRPRRSRTGLDASQSEPIGVHRRLNECALVRRVFSRFIGPPMNADCDLLVVAYAALSRLRRVKVDEKRNGCPPNRQPFMDSSWIAFKILRVDWAMIPQVMTAVVTCPTRTAATTNGSIPLTSAVRESPSTRNSNANTTAARTALPINMRFR
jgi:hypothetical protein